MLRQQLHATVEASRHVEIRVVLITVSIAEHDQASITAGFHPEQHVVPLVHSHVSGVAQTAFTDLPAAALGNLQEV